MTVNEAIKGLKTFLDSCQYLLSQETQQANYCLGYLEATIDKLEYEISLFREELEHHKMTNKENG